jgi:hypothetical protein
MLDQTFVPPQTFSRSDTPFALQKVVIYYSEKVIHSSALNVPNESTHNLKLSRCGVHAQTRHNVPPVRRLADSEGSRGYTHVLHMPKNIGNCP